MIVILDHIGIVARNIDKVREILDSKLGFSLNAGATPLPDGAYLPRRLLAFARRDCSRSTSA